ncbi:MULTISPECIES: hypothetical protein [Mycobacteriaceae]|uniref:hypothetical protein n=1 Tax=Mycobacteriaceae TaxID=1762 RepID=UPI0007EB47EE|nr:MULTISPECIES: hypothetical protein [Mycobacteriaceae]OBF76563.1 hypothetical protein A5751_23880 [Mycolicibacterium fortuitum]TMS50257.1 hypothetical protein E0T84_24605 [Mycobacterium sp. DBP42]
MTDELQFAQACADAAKHIRAIADELAITPDDSEAVSKALRDTLAVLQQLAGMEPPAQILASFHRTGTQLSTADTIRPDEIRGVAQGLGKMAENYAKLDGQGHGNWQ